MYCDNLMADSFLSFLSKCLCLLWRAVWKCVDKHCTLQVALGTHWLTEIGIKGLSDLGKFSPLTLVHIKMLR